LLERKENKTCQKAGFALRDNINNLLYNSINSWFTEGSHIFDNNVFIGRKNAVWPYVTRGGELTGFKITVFYRDGITVLNLLACNLA
jgi:hypothetical protein